MVGMSWDVGEVYRRLTLFTVRRYGAFLGSELGRVKMQATPLLRMAEALEKSLEDLQPIQSYMETFKGKSDEEALTSLFKLISYLNSLSAYLEQIGRLVENVNMLREQLKRDGLIFELPEITKPAMLETAKHVTLPAIKGFLKGLIEA
jgi:hypothetical protein